MVPITTLTPFHRVASATRQKRVTGVSAFRAAVVRATQFITGRYLRGVAYAGPGFVALAVDVNGAPARVDVRLYDAADGLLLGTAPTDARTGLLNFSNLPIGRRFRLETTDDAGDAYIAEIWDGFADPVC